MALVLPSVQALVQKLGWVEMHIAPRGDVLTKRVASIPLCHCDLGEGSYLYKLKKIPYRKPVEDGVSSSKKRRSFL